MDNNKTVKWNKIKFQCWMQQTKAKAIDCGKRAWTWCLNNPIPALTIAGGSVKLVKSGLRAYNNHLEDMRRDTDYYDTRTGDHCRSKVPKSKMTADQRLEINRRFRDNNESYVQILSDMGLLVSKK